MVKTRIYLPLNSTCNFSCSYCVAECNNNQNFTIYPQRANHYKNNKYMNFVNYHFNENDIISFSGGEPSHISNKDLVFHYLRNTKIKCDLMTNLSNPQFIYQIRNHCRNIYCTFHRGQITEEQFIKNLEFLLRKNIKPIIKEILFPNIIDKQLEFRKLITEKYKLEFEFEKFKPYKEGFYTNEHKSLLKMKNVTVGTTLNFCQCESEYDSIMINFNGDITKCWYVHKPIANIITDEFPIKLNTYIKECYNIKDGKLERELKYETSNEDLFENIGVMKILK